MHFLLKFAHYLNWTVANGVFSLQLAKGSNWRSRREEERRQDKIKYKLFRGIKYLLQLKIHHQ